MPYTELLLRPDLGKRPYKMHCRFTIWPHPSPEKLKEATIDATEMFVTDMHKQGFDYVPRYGWHLTGPFVSVKPVQIYVPPRLTAREMRDRVARGDRFLATGRETMATTMPSLETVEEWDFDIAGVFIHNAIRMEYAGLHEERR